VIGPLPPPWLAGPMHGPPVAPGPGSQYEELQAALGRALSGVALGDHDGRVIRWLQAWDVETVATVASLLYRARAAGVAGERTRLADLLRAMHTRQSTEFDAQAGDSGPTSAARALGRSYLDGIEAAHDLVVRGGVDGVTVRVDTPGTAR
jgi:hypothetical protein